MGLPNLPFAYYTASRQLISGLHINKLTDLLTSYMGKITALAGGAQAGSPVLNGAFIDISTVATGADSVQLPVSQLGLRVLVTNDGANSVQIFGNIAEPLSYIQGTIGTTGVALASGATALFICTKANNWKRFVSA